MIINIVVMLLSLGVTGIIYYYTGMYQTWGFYFLAPVMFVVSFFIILFLYMFILFIFSYILKASKAKLKPRKFFYGIIKETTIALMIMARVKIRKHNMKEAPKKERFLIVSNHQSNFDPMLVFKCFRTYPISCITKPKNLDIPIAGGWIKYAGFIPINRENNYEAVKSITLASKFIKEDKASICIYPEGTRNFDGGLLDFHPGSFKIATKAQCPIAICCTENTKMIKKNFPYHRTVVDFSLLKVLYPEEYNKMTTIEIAEYARNLILNKLNENKAAN